MIVIQINANIKSKSAVYSNFMLRFGDFDFNARKDSVQLLDKHKIATTANSSKKVECAILEIFKDVKIIRQKPNKLEAAFKICGDLFSILV